MSTDPLDGDLGLRLTLSLSLSRDGPDSPPPRSGSGSAPLAADSRSQSAATHTHAHGGDGTPTSSKISFPLPPRELDPRTLARLNRAVLAFAVVEFDIDQGPTLDCTYPRTAFPRAVQQNIAFSSLPEGADLARREGDGYAYSWRIPSPDHTRSLYGYVWFVRERVRPIHSPPSLPRTPLTFTRPDATQDSRLRRGYAQRSLVLITHLGTFPGLFSTLMQILGPLHFKHAQYGRANGNAMVETACHNIASWPDLAPGTSLELPFLGSVLTVAFPLSHQVQLPPPSSSFPCGSAAAGETTLSASPWSSSSSSGRQPRTQNLPYTHPPSPFLSQQAWSASDRPGTVRAAAAAANKRTMTTTTTTRTTREGGPGGLLGQVAEGTIPASLPATPLCVLLFAGLLPSPPPVGTTTRSDSHRNGGGGVNLLAAPPSLSKPTTMTTPPPAHPLRKSPSVGSSSAASSAKALGAVDFSTLVTLWELLVLGEPILVWSGDPKTGSEVVEGLKALIKPIPFAGDDRPYLHVHDPDFARLCRPGEKPGTGLLVAATNPLLLMTCKHWPHILRLDRFVAPSSSSASTTSPGPTPTSPVTSARSPSIPPPTSSPIAGSSSLFRLPQRSASIGSRTSQPGASQNGALDHNHNNKSFGLKTTRRRHVKKDEAVQKEIETLWLSGNYSACDSAIYRYFASLTEHFLAPLNRYFGTLWAGNEVVARTTPLLSPGPHPAPSTRFSASAFVTSLRAHGSSLSFRSSAPSLSQPGTSPLERFYLRFIESSPHFRRWLDDRIVATGGEVRKRYVRQLESVDVEDWAREKRIQEVEDLVGTLEREVGRLEGSPTAELSASTATVARPSLDSSSAASATSSSPTPSSADGRARPISAESPTAHQGPAAKLRAQASRLRLIRDEKARSLSLERGRSTDLAESGPRIRSTESV
ncbi:hypothetical protein JCM3774_006588 [Rhodotorula dairenensis]